MQETNISLQNKQLGVLLSLFMTVQDITIILQTLEEYCRDATNLKPLDLEHILKLITLSPLQEEMLSYHYWLHHELFPKLITLAEKVKFQSILLL
jgi:hypothetical protein